MKETNLRKVSIGVVSALLMVLLFSINLTPVRASDSNISAQSGTVKTTSDWSQVQGLIDNASENDIIDITDLCLSTANTTLTISKNIVIKCQPTNKPYYEVVMKDLFFDISQNATLTLENVAIENTQLGKSIISGTGNTVVSKSRLEPGTANGIPTVYNAPATIKLQGDVTVKTDGDLFSSSVAGATILEKSSGQTGTAGTAIEAVNVTVNGGHITGGASFESNCKSGDGIVASGNVIIKGVRQGDDSNAEVQSGSVREAASGITPGLPIRFTESTGQQRVLAVHGGNVLGNNKSGSASVAPYTVKMSEKDIAIIDNSKIGWYTDTPIFSDGFYYITNPIKTWGTLLGATEVYPLKGEYATLSGTKVVTLGDTTTHYAPENAQITITANAPASGKKFKEWIAVPNEVTFGDAKNTNTTFPMPAKEIKVTATYEDTNPITPHTHSPAADDGDCTTSVLCTTCGDVVTPAKSHNFIGSWQKDADAHWHSCGNAGCTRTADKAAHTWDDGVMTTQPTEEKDGVKTFTCTICSQTKTESVKLPTKEEVVDPETGSKVEYEDGSKFDETVELMVTPQPSKEINKYEKAVDQIAKGSTIANLYDVKLLKNGVAIQPGGKIKVTIKQTKEMKAMKNLQVVYISDTGKVTIIPSQVSEDKIVFVTDHFSYYGVIGKEEVKVAAPKTVATKALSKSTVRVAWSKVSKATEYAVYKASSQKGTYTLEKKVKGTTVTIGGLKSGKTYYFKVRAKGAAGYGGYSKIASAKTKAACPCGQDHSKAWFKLNQSGKSTVKVTWTSQKNARYYQVANNHTSNKAMKIKWTGSNKKNCYLSMGKSKGKNYQFKMRTVTVKNGKKVYGPWTGTVCLTMK